MNDASSPRSDASDGSPAGDVYDWYLRSLELMDAGNNAAAVQLLQRAVLAEPSARSLREALARAQFDARMFPAAEQTFGHLVALDPTDHYAQFGLGLALSRQGRAEAALEPLALAVAMRPDLKHYGDALRQARATARARTAGGGDATDGDGSGGSVGPSSGRSHE